MERELITDICIIYIYEYNYFLYKKVIFLFVNMMTIAEYVFIHVPELSHHLLTKALTLKPLTETEYSVVSIFRFQLKLVLLSYFLQFVQFLKSFLVFGLWGYWTFFFLSYWTFYNMIF